MNVFRSSLFRTILLSCVAGSCLTFMGAVLSPASGGAPVSSTGAPSEQTCAKSGCHDDGSINSEGSTYEAGKTYRITVSMRHPVFTKRFGFQLVALDEKNNNAGTFRLADEEQERTQILRNPNELTDRQYITYTYPGTEATAAGIGLWTVDWTAPETINGPITLYAATVAANNDNTDSGDEVYTFSQTITPLKSSVTSVTEDESGALRIFPNPAQNELHIALPDYLQQKTIMRIISTNGQIVLESVAANTTATTLDIRALAKGRYTLQFVSATGLHKSTDFIKE